MGIAVEETKGPNMKKPIACAMVNAKKYDNSSLR